MSTFGGDSWVPETLYRKKRVAELLGEEIEEDEVRLLSSGGLACLVCPGVPVLDTVPMLHIHRNGARHQEAAENLREEKRRLHQEIQKRIATGSCAVPSAESASISGLVSGSLKRKAAPLLTTTRNIKDAVLLGQVGADSQTAKLPRIEVRPYVSKRSNLFFQSGTDNFASTSTDNWKVPASPQAQQLGYNFESARSVAKPLSGQKRKHSDSPVVKVNAGEAMLELRRAAQREMKWKESGWKRDAAGHWSRDENVEYDSDEEIPIDDLL